MKWVEVHSHNTPGPQRLFILHWLIDKLFLFIHLLKKYWGGVTEVTQWAKAIATKPDDLSVIPSSHMAEEKKQLAHFIF